MEWPFVPFSDDHTSVSDFHDYVFQVLDTITHVQSVTKTLTILQWLVSMLPFKYELKYMTEI